MPLVEIDLLQGRAQAELDAISDVVHDAMVACSTFHSATGFRSSPNVPPGTCALTRTTSLFSQSGPSRRTSTGR